MLKLIALAVDYFAPLFLTISPITSYSDQIWSMHKAKSSAGFSLDICLIMLFASILKIFYWFGAYYSTSLLIQAVLMIGVQVILLKVALDNRPSRGVKDGLEHAPFSSYYNEDELLFKRPYNFWQWKDSRPYWNTLAYLSFSLFVIHTFVPPIAHSPAYIALLGYAGLAIEAVLPLPQIYQNHTARSCKGFRISVLVSWLAGDVMKMSYFFLSAEVIPWPFRLCGMFQAACDCYLGVQYWMYGAGVSSAVEAIPMTEVFKDSRLA